MKKNLITIWSSFFFAIIIYALPVMTLAKAEPTPFSEILLFLVILAVMSVSDAVIAMMLRMKWIHPLLAMKPNSDQEGILKQLQTYFIIVWACCEAPAVFGIIAVVLSGNMYLYLPFGILSLILLAVNHPFGVQE